MVFWWRCCLAVEHALDMRHPRLQLSHQLFVGAQGLLVLDQAVLLRDSLVSERCSERFLQRHHFVHDVVEGDVVVYLGVLSALGLGEAVPGVDLT